MNEERRNVICDLDGTIALDHHRCHYLHDSDCPKRTSASGKCSCLPGQKRDWKSYFAACGGDAPCEPIISLLHMLKHSHVIWILSGRSMSAFDETDDWLERHDVPYHHLQMRGQDDRTDDHLLKLKWAEHLGLSPANTAMVFEDRQRVVDAWRAKGFLVLQVAAGNF